MTLPLNLVLVRHGESEGNVANRHSRKGDNHFFTAEHLARHSSSWRLTDRGTLQAKAAGRWLRENGHGTFERYYSSEYIRAVETAANLELPNASWRLEFNIRERDHGFADVIRADERAERFHEYDKQYAAHRFYAPLPEGETMATLCQRLKSGFLTQIKEGKPAGSVIAVSHSNVMWALRVILERWSARHYHEASVAEREDEKINNCQIIEYSRVDPRDSSHILPSMGWVRSVCPWDLGRSPNEWRAITRPRYSNSDLIALVNAHERLIA